MSIQSVGFKAYADAMQAAKTFQREHQAALSPQAGKGAQTDSFSKMVTDSLSRVNEMDNQKSAVIESFASGETQNVHELMITLQKAGLAMSMTSAVRGKVLEAYKELMRISF